MSPRRRGHGRRGGQPTPGGTDASASRAAEATAPDRASDAAPARAEAGAPPRNQGRPRGPAHQPRPAAPHPPAGESPAEDAVSLSVDDGERKPACTLPQMRRFIKSRPYVPLHELRRRFEIGGLEDEVSRVGTRQGPLYIGLPEAEAGYLGELLDAGEVGVELLLDPTGPAVVGVYPMKPVARQ